MVVLLVFSPLLLLIQTLVWIGLLLDELLFPGYRKVGIKEPIFVVGIPRSGTTLLHRLLALDTDRFISFRLWEVILAPSITGRYFLTWVGRVDRALGGPGRRLIGAIEKRLLRDVNKMHKIGLFETEEDYLILTPYAAHALLLAPFPYEPELEAVMRFDDAVPEAERARIMAFYKRCVQRHLYFHGPDKQLLSKNPGFSAMVASLDTTFPDCKVVCCARTPHDAVPSFCSLMSYFCGVVGVDAGQEQFRALMLDACGYFYRHPQDCLAGWPANRRAFVLYDALTSDLRGTVTALYAALGLDMNPAFAEALAEEAARARTYKSRHSYDPADFGLTRENIREKYGDVFLSYGIPEDLSAGEEVRAEAAS
ncbi:MAG TPA: sulfotransferase [Candidatus Hydrogenedentes bacterium]|nr:sulfotransferase [Candidatus Hydrogenedentota bacterium]